MNLRFLKIMTALFLGLSLSSGIFTTIEVDSINFSERSEIWGDIISNNHLDERFPGPKSSTPFENTLNLSFVFSTRFDHAEEVDVVGNLTYVACEGLRIFNSSDPYFPEELGWYNGSRSRGLCVLDDYAYITGSAGLEIINVSDPTDPTQIGRYDNGSSTYDVDVLIDANASYAYIANGYDGLGVVNITDPTNPVLLWEGHSSGIWALDVWVRYPYVYVAADYGLFLYDISNPAAPEHISSNRNTNANSLHVEGPLAYIADRDGVSILDISNPLSLKQVQNIPVGHDIFDVHVEGCLLFICFSDGLLVYDIVKPKKPNLVGLYFYSPFCVDNCILQKLVDVYIQGSFVYFTGINDGLIILKIEGCDGCCKQSIPGYSIITLSLVLVGTSTLIYIFYKKRTR